ncbi:MAG: alkaline phosphatase family protein [Gammaproteobacteria bacterium]|nr:alkaline phosphatase family protein [Gammaproteobacteria bacterium]
MLKPAYDGGSIVNLMSSIGAGLGDRPRYPPLAALEPREVAEARNVVLIVLDGLGDAYLAAQRPGGALMRHRRERMTTVFPSTTASAITSFMTGLAPQQHAMTGWFVNLREVGAVAAILPFRPRAGGNTFTHAGVDPRRVFDYSPLFERIDRRSWIVTDERIVDSDYSATTSGPAERVAYSDLDECFARVRDLVRAGKGPRYVYVYWPRLDGLAHELGIAGPEAAAHLRDLDVAFERLVEELRGTDTLVIVAADHGLIDTDPEHIVHLHDHPELDATLALPLCGEPRAAYCYVRSGAGERFEHYVERHLSHCCSLHRGADLIREGYYGRFEPHPRLHERVGDYVLLARERYVIKDRVLGEDAFAQIGVHGGLSADELHVPLIVAHA